jgi:hypothetical protein
LVRERPLDDKIVQYTPWMAWFFPAFISETILMFPTAYFMGLTVYYGAWHGWYIPDAASLYGHPALMYGEALAWLVTAVILVPIAVVTCIRVIISKPKNFTVYSMSGSREEETNMREAVGFMQRHVVGTTK